MLHAVLRRAIIPAISLLFLEVATLDSRSPGCLGRLAYVSQIGRATCTTGHQ